jgi:hypothetical protein
MVLAARLDISQPAETTVGNHRKTAGDRTLGSTSGW